MASFPSNGGMYHVLSSDSVAKVFRRLYLQAKNEGRADAFMSAVHIKLATDSSEHLSNSASQCIAFPECTYKFARSRLVLS